MHAQGNGSSASAIAEAGSKSAKADQRIAKMMCGI
jgi:hypothetical protein